MYHIYFPHVESAILFAAMVGGTRDGDCVEVSAERPLNVEIESADDLRRLAEFGGAVRIIDLSECEERALGP